MLPRVDVPFVRRERAAFCDTALALGPSAPTLCGGWDVATLVAHLLVRERSAAGAPGILVPRLEGLADRAMQRRLEDPFEANVALLRRPPRLSPLSLDRVDRLVNTVELFVHHEDVRRAGAGRPARVLPDDGREDLWLALRVVGGVLVRRAGLPVGLRRTDAPGGEGAEAASSVLGAGRHAGQVVRRFTGRPRTRRAPVTVVGDTGELVLYCYGRRDVADVRVEGDEVSVRRLAGAPLGL